MRNKLACLVVVVLGVVGTLAWALSALESLRAGVA
jgi:hypothetical protein